MPQTLATAFAALALTVGSTLAQQCQSFGVDFQDDGSYFQNISSPDPFTFVSTFQGCQTDVANNLLVDPNGDEVMCSDTNLTPPNVNQLSTCPTLKNQLVDGEWSVLIISNNGNGSAIAYERDLFLTVGVPTTITSTPTVTVTATTSAVLNSTILTTELDTVTVTTTTTKPWLLALPTLTLQPKNVVTSTKTLGTITKTKICADISYVTSTSTASCQIPQPTTDKWCRKTPTLVQAAAMMTGTATKPRRSRFQREQKRETRMRLVPVDREQRVKERKERLARSPLKKRSPDSATVTITETNTALFPITTSFVTAGTSTMTITDVISETSTATITQTVVRGPLGILPPITLHAHPFTFTKWRFTVAETDVTKTISPTVTMTSIAYPTGMVKECKSKGGRMQKKHKKH